MGLVVIVVAIATCLGAYRGAFQSTVPVTVRSSNAGLGLLPGTKVMLHGVKVGRVTGVEHRDGGARIQIALNGDMAADLPSDVRASIDASTAFGPKVIALDVSGSATEQRLRAGDTIQAEVGTAEMQDLFAHADRLLTTIDPGKLHTALTGLASSLDGRGAAIGELISSLADYVAVVNTVAPAISADIVAGARVVDSYADSVPDLTKVLANTTSTLKTIISVRPDLRTFLSSISTSAGSMDALVRAADQPLSGLLRSALPASTTLAKFAPVFPCVIRGMDEDRKLVNAVMGSKYPALVADGLLLPGQRGFTFEESLPRNVAGIGTHCYGLPLVPRQDMPVPHVLFDDGTRSIWEGEEHLGLGEPPMTLSDSLFGESLQALLAQLDLGGAP